MNNTYTPARGAAPYSTRRLLAVVVLFVAALLGGSTAAWADGYTSQKPEAGKSYYLYNVGQNQFATLSDSILTLGGSVATLFTLSSPADNVNGYYHLTTAAGRKLSATLFGKPSVGSPAQGSFDQWAITAHGDNAYTISCRMSTAGQGYLYYSVLMGRLATEPLKPWNSFDNARWQLVSEDQMKTKTVTLDEDGKYTQPDLFGCKSATVQLKRTFTLGSWNSFCVPFAITKAEFASQFGKDARIAEYNNLDGETVNFHNISATFTSTEAGKPYLVKPTITTAPKNDTYTFTGITAFESQPQNVTGTVEFTGSFDANTTVPQGSYVLRNNLIYHLQSSMTMKGYRAYITLNDGNQAGGISSWSLDDSATAITVIEGDADGQPFDVYNLSGQRVRHAATSLDGLPRGVYVVNGKKVTK